MKKKIYFGTNTKMTKTASQTAEFVSSLAELTRDLNSDELRLFVIPSFTAIRDAARLSDEGRILIGGQNMGWEAQGAYTGEVSPLMLKEAGAGLAMIGHSERRHIFQESDEMENAKVKCAVENGLVALLCIGETAGQKNWGISDEVLSRQLKIGLHGLDRRAADKLWIAYEPVWAIGENGVPATAAYAGERHRAVRSCLRELFHEAAEDIPILYGGSVNAGNAVEMIGAEDVDGLFIGRSAWDPQSFNMIIRKVLAATAERRASATAPKA